MAGWDSTPWFVGGGAQHSAEVARTLAYAALRGEEGVIGADSCKVGPLSVPGGSVTVAPGAASILCRAAGTAQQVYTGRLPAQDTVPIAPTGSSGGRSDMIVARVEDPYVPGGLWQPPSNPAVGPYMFTRVIPNVPASARTVAELNLGYSAIPLARVTLPASTGTITAGMITDLRTLALPRRERRVYTGFPVVGESVYSTGMWATWSAASIVNGVPIPSWATRVILICSIVGARAGGNVSGAVRVNFGSTMIGQGVNMDQNALSTNPTRFNAIAADTLTVPTALRGGVSNLKADAFNNGGAGTVAPSLDDRSTVIWDVQFEEAAV